MSDVNATAAAGSKAGSKAPTADSPKPPKIEKVIERKVQPLANDRLEEAEYRRNVLVATAHVGTVPADLLKPEYWAYVSPRLKPWDEIHVRADDGTWYAKYLVTEAGRTFARTHMLENHNLTSRDVALSQAPIIIGGAYEVKYRGEHNKWSVVRTTDASVMHEFEETQGGAVNWANERLKADR